MEEVYEEYSDQEVRELEAIWGEGFLSPGGAAEVARIVGTHDIAGRTVLDVGCGVGGAAIALVRNHGAASVLGMDVKRNLIDKAVERVASAGLGDRVTFRLVEPGPLPFADTAFDVVFSKEAILQVEDKAALYAEVFRVMRRAGHLLVGDWLRGAGDHLTLGVEDFLRASGDTFTMATLDEIVGIIDRTGFTAIETEDRRAWYLEDATGELERLGGPMGAALADQVGERRATALAEFWATLVASLASGALSPAHIRARKPGGAD
jgi:phosphoethanolamine N-methyltransferase